MRLLSFTVMGAALIAAGLAAPVSVEQGEAGDAMRFGPALPGGRVRIEVPACAADRVESAAFAGEVRLGGRSGTAALKPEIRPGSYLVIAHCGSRTVTGRLPVSEERPWPSLLPGALNYQMARLSGDH